MSSPGKTRAIVLGATGLIGTAMVKSFQEAGIEVVGLSSSNYSSHVGQKADVLVNCNGNSYRFKANQNPRWDFEASVTSVEKSLFDFEVKQYLYISTVDVYSCLSDPAKNCETSTIETDSLDTYGFHKWLAERLVEKFAPKWAILRAGTVIGEGLKKGPVFDLLNRAELHMNGESELSLIDTNTIAQTAREVISRAPEKLILNLTGSGFVTPATLAKKFNLPLVVSEKGRKVKHQYHLNNEKLKTLIPVKTAEEIGVNFIRSALG